MVITAALAHAAFAQGASVGILHWIVAFIVDVMIASSVGSAN